MESMIDVIARIEAAKAEQQYLLDCLKVWDAAKQAGYEPDEVKAFSFRDEFLTKDQKAENRRHGRYQRAHPYNGYDWHNCARLTNGELVPIPIVKRPVKPLDKSADGK